MVRKIIGLVFLCLFFAVQAYGQVSDSAVVTGKSVSQPSGTQMTITGKVTDEQGEPLPGATIVMKGNVQVNSVTNDVGNFQITLPKGAVVVVSFVGMVTKEIKVDKQKQLQIVLSDDVAQLKGVEVVGNGMFMRRSETFTGSAATFTGEQLRLNGSVNALQSLKNLDPSFVINENVDMGSNPNSMPDVQFRGQSSIDLKGDYETSPNLPLFILNGFETSLEKIVDMDMNLIQSITILKDAAAKAIYGSKAANGVVVVETVQPKQGRLRVSYNGSLELTVPDLNIGEHHSQHRHHRSCQLQLCRPLSCRLLLSSECLFDVWL